MAEWYWCLEHGMAEQGRDKCKADNRLGPYESEEAARNFRERHESREDTWEEQDEAWEGTTEDD